jgi:uncharacterized protein (TIGR00288 family)
MPDDDSHQVRNVALLIDADNASPESLDPALTVLAELGTVNIRRAYGNWSKAGLKGWAKMTHRYAIEPHQQFDVTKGKSATDMKMTIDAMDLLFRGNVDGFGIMSSDSDFMPLAMRIRQEGVPVYGFGGAKTPDSFKQACTRFIDVAALQRASVEPMPAERGTESEPKVDKELLDLLSAAWKASKRDDRGFARLAELGERAGNRSSFDARNYGVSRLSELIDALPNFVTEKRDNGAVWVKRLR